MYNANKGMYANYEVESSKEYTESKSTNSYMGPSGMNMGSSMACASEPISGMVCPPVYECPQERIIHREICHEVPHVCPINTRIINHHIYKHTYSPCYSCCDQNDILTRNILELIQ